MCRLCPGVKQFMIINDLDKWQLTYWGAVIAQNRWYMLCCSNLWLKRWNCICKQTKPGSSSLGNVSLIFRSKYSHVKLIMVCSILQIELYGDFAIIDSGVFFIYFCSVPILMMSRTPELECSFTIAKVNGLISLKRNSTTRTLYLNIPSV